jgi:DNA repair exonuclease SbcCD ATPase subunit
MKELLEKLANGESTVDDVLKAIDEADKDKVPRSRLNDKIEDIKDLQKQLSDRDKQLKDLSKKAEGNEDLQEQIKKLQEDNKKVKEDYENRLAEKTFDFSLEKALSDAKAKNPRAVKALLNREAIKLDGDKLLGLEEQLKALQESDGYLFGDNEPVGLKGRQPNPPAQNHSKELTKDQFNQMGYAERSKLYSENPDLYKQLSE